ERLRQRCAGLGLKLESVTLQELHPPPEVVPSFHEVARAMEDEQRMLNEAREKETERLGVASAEKTQVEHEGKVERHRITTQATANLNAFLARWKVRSNLGPEQEA